MKSLPAWFHLPPGYTSGKLPVVISIPGMDSFKESAVALANDRWMQRSVAVLAIDGPGQYEAPLLGVFVEKFLKVAMTARNWNTVTRLSAALG